MTKLRQTHGKAFCQRVTNELKTLNIASAQFDIEFTPYTELDVDRASSNGLDNICFLFGINKTSLCQSFKDEYGITVLNYINKLKIAEAKRLLRENKLSVTSDTEKMV